MSEHPRFLLRTDLERAVVDGFAFPLGLRPNGLRPPPVGYSVEYVGGEDDDPDSYTFYVITSCERLGPLVEGLFGLLPDEVHPIVEIGSRDAYRALDVWMSDEPVPIERFLETWDEYRDFLLEDGSIAAGANGASPEIEVFVDHWKGVNVHVPLLMRDDVERVLHELGYEETGETWPELDEDEAARAMEVRPVLATTDDAELDMEDLLLDLRHAWGLELNVDPYENLDDTGRSLGRTLWHALVIVQPEDATDPGDRERFLSVWAAAESIAEVGELVDESVAEIGGWNLADVYTLDRVAFDERPEALDDLVPVPRRSEVLLVEFDPPEDDAANGSARAPDDDAPGDGGDDAGPGDPPVPDGGGGGMYS